MHLQKKGFERQSLEEHVHFFFVSRADLTDKPNGKKISTNGATKIRGIKCKKKKRNLKGKVQENVKV